MTDVQDAGRNAGSGPPSQTPCYGIFIDQFKNITFLAIKWIIELKMFFAPSSQQICGLRFVFLINQDIPGATKETKQVTPSQHGKVT